MSNQGAISIVPFAEELFRYIKSDASASIGGDLLVINEDVSQALDNYDDYTVSCGHCQGLIGVAICALFALWVRDGEQAILDVLSYAEPMLLEARGIVPPMTYRDSRLAAMERAQAMAAKVLEIRG